MFSTHAPLAKQFALGRPGCWRPVIQIPTAEPQTQLDGIRSLGDGTMRCVRVGTEQRLERCVRVCAWSSDRVIENRLGSHSCSLTDALFLRGTIPMSLGDHWFDQTASTSKWIVFDT